MASPLDAAHFATQAYKLRPASPSGARPRSASGTVAPDRASAPVPGRREAAAVSLSLSAEALSILNGGDRRTAPTRRDPYPGGNKPDAGAPETAQAAAAPSDLFEPLDASRRFRREAPFAHLDGAAKPRPLPPGSRLDITI